MNSRHPTPYHTPFFSLVRLTAMLVATLAALTAVPALADSGLPIPRFVSVNTNQANVRTGPGQQYPIEWVFVRRGMPVEVVAEFDVWRKVRDWEGAVGWIHRRLLSGRRTLVVVGEEPQHLMSEPRDGAPIVARVEPGVVGRMLACPDDAEGAPGDRCYSEIGGFRGWLPRTAFWGVYPDEIID